MRSELKHEAASGEASPPVTPTVTAGSPMRAIVQEGYGSAGVLRLARTATPTASGSDVLVRVHAAGVDRGTWHLMTGRPYLVRLISGPRGPRNPVPGLDMAGTVAAVGPEVTRFSVGDEVFGFGRGTFADYTLARESKLAPKPAGMSFEQAGVVPVSGVTALLALTDAGHVQPGQKVLITGASGGVGSYAVQLAKALGAEVTGVCGTAKLDLVRSLGATCVIDYTTGDFADGTARYDLIIDIAGNPSLSRLRRALTPAGTAVIVGGEDGGDLTGMSRQLGALALSPLTRQRLTILTPRQRSSDLARLTTFIDAGTVTPSIGATYPLERVPEAMRYLEAGKACGKIAITI